MLFRILKKDLKESIGKDWPQELNDKVDFTSIELVGVNPRYITGYVTEKGKIFNSMPASLKYYKVDYVPISDRMYYEYADELLVHIRELVELENGVNFTGNKEIAIVLTEEELDKFITDIDSFSSCKKIYMGHDLLPSEEQEIVIAEHKIKVNVIPDYYYRDLQEE